MNTWWKYRARVAVGLMLGLLLCGCGQMGPLYLPDDAPAAEVPPDADTVESDSREEKKP